MFKYILKRVAIFIPTLFVISLFTFMLSVSVPGDPVEQMMNAGGGSNADAGMSMKQASEKAYLDKREELGLHLPVFYFALSNLAEPDTLNHIARKPHRKTLSRFINEYGNWPEISNYYQGIKSFDNALARVAADSLNADPKIKLRDAIFLLYIHPEDHTIRSSLQKMKTEVAKAPSLSILSHELDNLNTSYAAMVGQPTRWKNYVPAIHWYGMQNQYHHWITGFMTGDFGISYQDSRPVKTVLLEAVRWTVLLSLLSIILTYIIALPLGVMSAAKKGSKSDQVISTFLFILYSLPSFWVATLLITFFGGGDFLKWFPAYGVGELEPGMSIFEQIGIRAYHLVLPLICWTYGSLAFLSRQMRGGMLNALTQDFVRTARAKGLDERTVIWKHAFKNSLLPIITLFASVFPLAISGSIALEIIFSIDGMGKLAFEALVARNYPVVYAVVMFSAILTLVGYLVADILYAAVDPRISYTDK
jgi:peptide/nickel transport system permease protein